MGSREVTRQAIAKRYTMQSYLSQLARNPRILTLGVLYFLGQRYISM